MSKKKTFYSHQQVCYFLNTIIEAGGMVPQLRALAAFPQEPGSAPRTYMAAHNHLLAPVPGNPTSSLGLHGHQTHKVFIPIHRQILTDIK